MGSDAEIEEEKQQSEEVTYPEGDWKKYLWGENAATLLFGYFYKVNPFFGIYYLCQFILALSACNFYSDSDRFLSCGITGYSTP